ncbi:MAG: phosphatase PAP2 family protein [Candidatus Methanofastidiosia archaeon]
MASGEGTIRKIMGEIKFFLSFKMNRVYIIIVAIFLMFYQSIQFYITPPGWYVTFSPDITIWLQKTLSHPQLDYIISYYYPIGFISCLILLNYLVIKEGKNGWKWGAAILACWSAHLIIEMVYPVAPPLRWASGARPIRLEVFPLSDILVGVKYGGMPSGHFGYVLLGLLIARHKFNFTKDTMYKKTMIFLLVNLLLTVFTVLYLGEHTWEDLAGSFVIFGGVFWIFSRYVGQEEFSNISKKTAPTPASWHEKH